MDWGEKIKEIAEKRGMSVRQLAAEMNVNYSYLNDVVRGKSPPSNIVKAKIIDRLAFEVTIESIMQLLPDEVAESVKKAKTRSEEKRIEKANKKIIKNGDQ